MLDGMIEHLNMNQFFPEGTVPAVVIGNNTLYSETLFPLVCPVNGMQLARCGHADSKQMEEAVFRANECFRLWRRKPAPERGQLVRVIAELARARKPQLGSLITLEVGKTVQEAEGEIQELIDVCDYAVGLSRQLHGLTIASERPDHRMMEQWHPLGVVGVITAFNFPVAVWGWNAMIAFVCGDPVIWKPSEKAPLCALACHSLVMDALEHIGWREYECLSSVINGGGEAGEFIASNNYIPLVSATGSVPMGKAVGERVGKRLGRALLELGGNNGLIVTSNADLDLALKATVFSAVGTTGQRCTSLRRLFLHSSIHDEFLLRLVTVYKTLVIGDPRDENNICGPLVDEMALQRMLNSIEKAEQRGGVLLYGGERITEGVPAGGVYVTPAIMSVSHDHPVVREETFAPLLYVIPYDDLDEVIEYHNDVTQGLSSAIFTTDVREAERFLSVEGSDCGIANVNIGTSGAEIGGAFGGEKDTGGGRESGSDAWKNYMRRATNTVNYGSDIPLAQGIRFDV